MSSQASKTIHNIVVDFSFIKLDLSSKYWKPHGWIIVVSCQHPPRLRHLLVNMTMVLRLRENVPTRIIFSWGWCCIWHQTQKHMFPLRLIIVTDLIITPGNHMRLMWKGYGSISKVLRTRVRFKSTHKKMIVDFYADADFVGIWVHENTQEPICARIRTGFVVKFSIFPILRVSKLHAYIVISTIHYEYVELYSSVRDLLTLEVITKEVIDNLVIYFEKLQFVSTSTVYKDNNDTIVLVTSPSTTPKPKHITIRYYWFRQKVGKDIVIKK